MSAFILALALAQGLVVGDSIALGTGQAMGAHTVARVGMSSCWIADRAPRFEGEWAVISAGINDAPGPCIERVRERLHAGRVVWVLPAPINGARAHVEAVAAAHGDRTVSYACAGGCSKANFHPASYAQVAATVEAVLGLPHQAGRKRTRRHRRHRRA